MQQILRSKNLHGNMGFEFDELLIFEAKMQLQLEVSNSVNDDSLECIPWANLHLDFHRAILKRLIRRGEEQLMEQISQIKAIERLDEILEALLEGQTKAAIYSLI